MREKIVNLMKSEGLTSSRLAEILEIQPSGVSHIISGRNKPGFDLLQKILRRFPRINPDWLLLDSDQMYREDCDDDTLPSLDDDQFLDLDLFDQNAKSSAETGSVVAKKNKENLSRVFDQISGVGTASSEGLTQRRGVSVERVIIFYSDNTFDSYEMR